MTRAKVLTAALLGLVLWATPAVAKDAAVSWTNATTNTDGSTIPATGDEALKHTEVQWGLCDTLGAFPATAAGSKITAFPGTAGTVTGLGAGTWCFRARHANMAGITSAWSATGQKVIVIGRPRPPVIQP